MPSPQHRISRFKTRRSARWIPNLVLGSCLFFASVAPVRGGAFELYDQSSRATGLGGAVVARTDHPAALFYNVGGLAFLDQNAPNTEIGITTSFLSQSIFQGRQPGPGAGTNGEQDEFLVHRPHLFWVKSISPNVRVGVGHYQAFGLETEWLEPNTFSGRFLSLASELTALDVNAGAAIRLTQDFGIGLGVIYRSSELVLNRRLPGTIPDTLAVVDVGKFAIDTAMEDGFGWHAGIQNRLGKRLSWGVSHRSEIEIDYQGVGKLTQIKTGDDQVDALFKSTIPFDQNLGFVTTVTFPAQTSLGIAFGTPESFLVEADVNMTSWSDFGSLFLTYPSHPEFNQPLSCVDPGANSVAKCLWKDTTTYRLGLQLSTSHGTEFRFGGVQEETPQPTADLGPFFPDGDRTTFTAGIGRDWLDVAVSWTEVEQRTTSNNFEGFNGTYSGNIWVASFTVSK